MTFPHRLVAGAALRAPRRRVGLGGVLADLDREARHDDPPGPAASRGLTWRDDDARTERWFPQGITTSADAYGASTAGGTFEGHDVVLVSWYARGPWRGWLGARISVVDWHDDAPPRYRHVLLVDRSRRWWQRAVRVHAGGIVWYGQHLFVAGSGSGLRVFRLDDVVRVRNRLRSRGYRYVLPLHRVYAAEHDEPEAGLTYSFLSLERSADGDRLVAGEYGRRGGSHRLARYAIDPDTELLAADDAGRAVPADLHDDQVPRMQGAVVADGTWFLTASSGEGNPGDLWAGRPGAFHRHRGVLPTGPEDVTYLPQRRQLWTLTEWPGRRWAFPIDVDRWRPPASDAEDAEDAE